VRVYWLALNRLASESVVPEVARVQRDERVVMVKVRVYVFGDSLERLRFEIEDFDVP